MVPGGIEVSDVVQFIYEAILHEMDTQDHHLEVILDNIMRHTITGDNNITTHYVESGTNISDVTTTNPLTITVQGWMADICYSMNPVFQWVLTQIVQTANVPIIGGFVATKLSSVLFLVNLIYERVRKLLEWYNSTHELFGTPRIGEEIARPPSGYNDSLIEFDENMKLGYQLAALEATRISRTPMSLTIPRIGTFHNMCLKNYEWDQDKSYYQAKVTITFQQVRFTRTVLTRLVNGTVKERESEGKRDERSTIK